MADDANNTIGFGWKGIYAPMERVPRIAGEGALIILAISMILTQSAFFRLWDVHVVLLLVPIMLSAFLFGTKQGCLCGFISGALTMLHAVYLPLDYYERYFELPSNSIILFTVVGLVSGLAFSYIIARVPKGGLGRPLAFAGLAAAISALTTIMFQLTVMAAGQYTNVVQNLPDEIVGNISSLQSALVQVVCDAVIVLAAVLILDALSKRALRSRAERSIRSTFQLWLALLVAISFCLASGVTFAVSSVISTNEAKDEMNGQISYIVRQLAERDSWFRMMQSGGTEPGVAQRVYAQSVVDVASDMQLWGTGLILVADNDQIVSSNQAGYEGKSLNEVLEAGLIGQEPDAVFSTDSLLEYYLGNNSDIAYVVGRRSSYMRSSEYGSYQVVVALDSGEVFSTRTTLMVVIQGVCLLIFVIIYILAVRLLENVVVRSFDKTNHTLDLITEGDLDQRVSVRTSREFSSLSKGINTTVGALKDSIDEASSRYDRELATAKAIQASALPSTFPPFPQIDRFDLYATMAPAKEVGGDFYDFFLIGEDKLGFLIADVSGKGIPAALFMMTSKTQIANCIESGMALEQAVETANHHLCQGNEANMFVTAWMGVLDYKTGHLTYVNAGHNPPLLRHDGEWTWLRNRSGFILGAYDGLPYKSFEMDLAPGDMIFLYTDGVNEATDANDMLYGDDRMETFLTVNARLGPRACIGALGAELMSFQAGVDQADDITMLALAYGVAPEVAAKTEVAAKAEEIKSAVAFVDEELTRRLCPMDAQETIDRVLGLVCQAAIDRAPEGARMSVSYVYTTNPASFTVEVACPGEELDLIAAAEEGTLGFSADDVDDVACVRGDDENVFVYRVSW